MDCLELSIRKLEDECRDWAEDIKKEYMPDMVIYVAKAGYLIGKAMGDAFGVPLVGISAARKGNGIKSVLQPLLKWIPNKVRYFLIELELKSNVHKSNAERHISFISDLSRFNANEIKNIMVVDDSVDTGHSIKAVKEAIEGHFAFADVKIASLNVWDKSEDVIKTDFALYRNTIIKAPMSKDSREYGEFVKRYDMAVKFG